MGTYDRGAGRCAKLALACLIALAAPATAAAATPASITGPTSVDEGAGTVEYTITCGTVPTVVPGVDTPALGQIAYTTAGASEDADYRKASGTVACGPAPSDSHKVSVEVLDDSLDEAEESFTVTITPGPAFTNTIGAGTATTKIADNDVPTISLAGVAHVLEGDSASAPATLAVTLSQTPVEPVTVPYATLAAGALGATALPGSDYTAADGAITIPAGHVAGTISIPVVGDTVAEPVEAFFVELGTPTNATLNPIRAQGGVAIFDNDKPALPTFSIAHGGRAKEGNTGTVNVLFTVTLSQAAPQRTSVAWRTQNFTADSADYGADRGTLTFEPGQTVKTVSVDVKGDRRPEAVEAFMVVLDTPSGATLGQKAGFAIIDDDDPAPGPKVGIGSPKLEGRLLAVMLRCPAAATACSGRLTATAGKVRVGSRRFALAKGAEADVALRLSRKVRRMLRRRALHVRFSVVARDQAGSTGVVTETFRVARPKKS
jgi:hypothetical protein